MLLAALAPFLALVAANPIPKDPFPLANGFPAPSPAQVKQIQAMAGGSIPNGPLPMKLTPAAVAAIQLIALNEIFEVAYFETLLQNITTNVTGYELGHNRDFVIKSINQIVNQEQLHALGANAILSTAGAETITPCKYNVPVSTFPQAIALANTFTDVVLGVLPQAQTLFATDSGDELPLVNLIGSIIAQEGEQNGWFRSLQKKVPSAAPFLTTEGPSFAFTFLNSVIVPGSCPGVEIVKKTFPLYEPLTVLSKPTDKDCTATFEVAGTLDTMAYSVVYLSGQSLPVTVPIETVTSVAGKTQFTASIPFESEGFASGLTVAAVVKGTGKFESAATVAMATVFGPGVIEVN